jgi:hypothetical protein
LQQLAQQYLSEENIVEVVVGKKWKTAYSSYGSS